MVHHKKGDIRDFIKNHNENPEKMSENLSPRPTPTFFFEEQTFSSKKERPTPRERPPPTPRPRTGMKSCPPVSRLFSHTSYTEKAQSVSFRESDTSLVSKYYDENSNKLYFDQCFDLICKLGSGSFGEVFKVKSKEDGKLYAIKRSKERFRGKSDRLRKLEEVQKHEQLPAHPNCVRFYKAWEERQCLYIQTELCEKSLSQYAEENHDIPEKIVWNYLIDLLMAVKHLHDHNFVHLDIKPENIFVSEDGVCKLGDFGLVLDISNANTADALEGDPKYLAPELMQGIFTKAADVFSLGITILELACDLDLPRGDTAWHKLREKEIPAEFLKRISPELAEVICLMMEPDYNKRPTVEEVLRMPSVRKMYRKRMLVLQGKKMMSYLIHVLRWVIVCFSWLKPCFSYFKKEKLHLMTPSRKDQSFSPLDCDYSFSDEEVFEREDSAYDVVKLIDDDHFTNEEISLDDRCNSPTHSSGFRHLAVSTPGSYRYWESKLQELDTPSLNGTRLSPRMSSSPKPVRRSPRLAAMNSSPCQPTVNNKVLSPLTIGPKNLMEVFDAQLSDDD